MLISKGRCAEHTINASFDGYQWKRLERFHAKIAQSDDERQWLDHLLALLYTESWGDRIL